MPDPNGGADGTAFRWRILVAFVAGAVLAAVVAVVVVTSRDSPATPSTTSRPKGPDIAMGQAVPVDCGPPTPPGAGHPDPLLAQNFTVHAGTTGYTLGWEIVPYRGADRSYTFGSSSNLLALEPVTGGKPVGFGTGTITFSRSSEQGTIDAVVRLTAGGRLTVGGQWTCPVAPAPTTTTTPGFQ